MESASGQALFLAGLFSLGVFAVGAVFVTVCRRGASGRLVRNQRAGIRTPSTMRSDQAWVAGHRAAARHAPLYVIAALGISVALFALALQGVQWAVIMGGIGGVLVIVALSIFSAVVASRAARKADDGTDHRKAPVDYANLPTANVLSPRAAAAVSWTFAVLAWAATVLMLIGICYGYVQSIHHQLPPNGTFGFRDATTFACLPAWYAGQKAGFSWVLFGYGPILALSILICPAAAIKGRSPRDLGAFSMGTLFLAVFAVIIAGIHADSVARAVNC
jgi:SdpI/YhfL family protein